MFGQYPVANVNLPKPKADYSAQWLISLLEQAAFQQKQQGGVVHINVPFSEPLYDATDEAVDSHSWLQPLQRWLIQTKPWMNVEAQQNEVLMHENWDHWRTKRGVVVVGQLPAEQAMGINSWASAMGWVLLTDIQSVLFQRHLMKIFGWQTKLFVKNFCKLIL